MSKATSKNSSLGKSYRRTILAIILLVVVHYVLLRWMDGSNAFGVLTASGNNTPLLTTLGAMSLIGLRMYLYLIVPGMAMARVGSATLRWYADQQLEPHATKDPAKPSQSTAKTWVMPWGRVKSQA